MCSSFVLCVAWVGLGWGCDELGLEGVGVRVGLGWGWVGIGLESDWVKVGLSGRCVRAGSGVCWRWVELGWVVLGWVGKQCSQIS